jgi:hypothetical protein
VVVDQILNTIERIRTTNNNNKEIKATIEENKKKTEIDNLRKKLIKNNKEGGINYK